MQRVKYEKRFMAYCIDLAISLAISLVIMTYINMIDPFRFMSYMTLLSLCTGIIFFIYSALGYIFLNGLTIGRIILNDRIVMNDGRRLTIQAAIMRSMLQALWLLAICNVGYMLLYRTQESFFEKATETMNIPWR